MKKPKFIEGDRVRCIKTVAIDGSPKGLIAMKGHVYIIYGIRESCCGLVVDIGYKHHTIINNTCKLCGHTTKEQQPVYIPERYFRRARNKDKLHGKLDSMERNFAFLNK